VALGASLDGRENLANAGNRSLERPARSKQLSHYTAFTINDRRSIVRINVKNLYLQGLLKYGCKTHYLPHIKLRNYNPGNA